MDKPLIFDHLNSAYKAFVRLSESEYKIQDTPYDLAYSGFNNALFNYVRLKSVNPKDLEGVLERLKTPFTCIPSPSLDEVAFSQLMHTYGFIKTDTLTAQFFDNLQNFSYQLPQQDIQIKLVASNEDLDVLDYLCQDAYKHEKNLAKKLFNGLLNKSPDENQVRMFLAYWQGQPVGKGSLVTCDKRAGLYWDSVLPSFRKRGIGTVLIKARLELAKKLGYTEAVSQTLTPSRSCYQRAGFISYGSLPFYKCFLNA